MAQLRVLRVLSAPGEEFTAVAIAPYTNRVVSGSMDGQLRMWDEEDDEPRPLGWHSDSVRQIVLTQTGGHAVSASSDKTLKVWDLDRSGAELHTLKGHKGAVSGVALSRLNIISPHPPHKVPFAISCSFDGTLMVWDANTGERFRTLEGHSGHVYAIGVTKGWLFHAPDEERPVSVGMDGTVRVFDVEMFGFGVHFNPRTLGTHESEVAGLGVSADGRRAASGSLDGTLKLWDLEHGTELSTIRTGGRITWVYLRSDGQTAFVKTHGEVWAMDLGSGDRMASFLPGKTGAFACAVKQDERTLVAATMEGEIYILSFED